MRKYILTILIVTNWATFTTGQNLVPNGNFEFFSSCPVTYSQIYKAIPWTNPTIAGGMYSGGTSDYFNQCAGASIPGVPINIRGYQQARSGNGYSGIELFEIVSGSSVDFREYIEVPLVSPLIADSCYHFEMYVNLSNDSQYATDDLGVYFSDTLVSGINYSHPPPFIPQIENISGNFIVDTLNWVLVSGDYIASGGESYIIIGNFKFDTSTDTIAINSNPFSQFAYIYIDDISLTRTQSCLVGADELNIENKKYILYPNPFSNTTTIEFENYKNENHTLTLFDSQGRLVRTMTNIITDKVTIERKNLADGLYFFQLHTDKKVIATGKLTIEQ